MLEQEHHATIHVYTGRACDGIYGKQIVGSLVVYGLNNSLHMRAVTVLSNAEFNC